MIIFNFLIKTRVLKSIKNKYILKNIFQLLIKRFILFIIIITKLFYLLIDYNINNMKIYFKSKLYTKKFDLSGL